MGAFQLAFKVFTVRITGRGREMFLRVRNILEPAIYWVGSPVLCHTLSCFSVFIVHFYKILRIMPTSPGLL